MPNLVDNHLNESVNPGSATGRANSEVETTPAQARKVTDIYGLGDKSAPLSRVTEVANKLGYSDSDQILIKNIYENAQAYGKDRGADIIKLLGSISYQSNRSELLLSISNVAKADSLFNTSDKKELAQLRSSYLCDVVRMAADPDARRQGIDPLCTTTTFIQRDLSTSDFIKQTTQYALNGKTTLALGCEINFRPDFLKGIYQDKGDKETRAVYTASDGMKAYLRSIMEVGTAADQQKNGSLTQQYAVTAQAVSGKKVGVVTGEDKLSLDVDGKPTFTKAREVYEINAEDWLSNQMLESKGKKFEEIKGVPIDINWKERVSNSDPRHMCTALKSEMRVNKATGEVTEQWLIRDPRGALLKDGKEIAAGTIIGNNNFNFEVAEKPGYLWFSANTIKDNLNRIVVVTSEKAKLDDSPYVSEKAYDNENETHQWLIQPDGYEFQELKKSEYQVTSDQPQLRIYQETEVENHTIEARHQEQSNDGAEASTKPKRGKDREDEYLQFLAEKGPALAQTPKSKELVDMQHQASGQKPSNPEISRFIKFGFGKDGYKVA